MWKWSLFETVLILAQEMVDRIELLGLEKDGWYLYGFCHGSNKLVKNVLP